MRRVIESLLVLARIDAGPTPGAAGPVDLSEHARAAVDRIRPLAAARSIEIQCRLAPAATFVDADRLGQLITNLLSNAVGYNRPAGEIAVRAYTDGDAAVLIVEDTGGGIAATDLPHVFERFYRADQSRARVDGRSGLGLAICKAIVDAARGSIDVSSQLGAGTIVTVRLPGAEGGSRDHAGV